MDILTNIFILWIGASIGACGAFIMLFIKAIGSKSTRFLANVSVLAALFIIIVLSGSYAKVIFWGILSGYFYSLFAIAICSANSIADDDEF